MLLRNSALEQGSVPREVTSENVGTVTLLPDILTSLAQGVSEYTRPPPRRRTMTRARASLELCAGGAEALSGRRNARNRH